MEKKYQPVVFSSPEVPNLATLDERIKYLASVGRETYSITGAFVHSTNRINICSRLDALGMHRTSKVNDNLGLLVYTSDDNENPWPKIVLAQEANVPFVVNEAAACEMLDIRFHAATHERSFREKWEDHDKARGTTTYLAIGFIHKAMSSVGTAIQIEDHYPTRAASMNCLNIAQDMINKMGLRGFQFDRGQLTVTYHGHN